MQVEDHPMSYNAFEGTIPSGQYGGGTVMLWDRGTYAAAEGGEAELRRGYEAGRLDIVMHGERLRGAWTVLRTRKQGDKQQWLLMKRTDADAEPGSDVVARELTSIESGRTMDEITAGAPKRKAARSAASKSPDLGPPNARGVRAVKAERIASMPALEPMYASVGTAIPEGEGWTFEPKYDGIRVLAFATADAAQLVTRNGNDKAAQFPEVTEALRALARSARRPLVLDGEIVAIIDGAPARFQELQGRMHLGDAEGIAGHAQDAPAALLAFDLLLDGDDVLLAEPWTTRRARLEQRLGPRASARIQLGESIVGDGAAMLERARASGWEGVIAKRTDATYSPGQRSNTSSGAAKPRIALGNGEPESSTSALAL